VGRHNPSDNASANYFGNLVSDGATYEIWQKERINAPSIAGDNTDFQQYWSVRTSMHCGGTINTGNHFRAWEAAGLTLGTQNYMVMGIEGQQGSGDAEHVQEHQEDENAGAAPIVDRQIDEQGGDHDKGGDVNPENNVVGRKDYVFAQGEAYSCHWSGVDSSVVFAVED
jgi:hypothetical protein